MYGPSKKHVTYGSAGQKQGCHFVYSIIRLLHQGWKDSAGREIAAPFSSALLAESPLAPGVPLGPPSGEVPWLEGSAAGAPVPLYLAGASTSSLDLAHALTAFGEFPEWGSVVAHTQSSGRGQLRRHWISPPGNLYAALRLPLQGVFASGAASLAVGALLAEGLNAAGYPVFLKWPNDLLQRGSAEAPHAWRKIGGILLEERDGTLIAGIGINLASAPCSSLLREEHAFPAGPLCPPLLLPSAQHHVEQGFGQVFTLWRSLVEHIFFCYTPKISSAGMISDGEDWWFNMVSACLAFRRQPVRLVNAQPASGEKCPELVEGIMEGIDGDGALCLATERGREKFIGGSLAPMRKADSKR